MTDLFFFHGEIQSGKVLPDAGDALIPCGGKEDAVRTKRGSWGECSRSEKLG
jgi:hypothetical protein